MNLASFVSLVIMGSGRRNFAGNSLLASTFGELTFFSSPKVFSYYFGLVQPSKSVNITYIINYDSSHCTSPLITPTSFDEVKKLLVTKKVNSPKVLASKLFPAKFRRPDPIITRDTKDARSMQNDHF